MVSFQWKQEKNDPGSENKNMIFHGLREIVRKSYMF